MSDLTGTTCQTTEHSHKCIHASHVHLVLQNSMATCTLYSVAARHVISHYPRDERESLVSEVYIYNVYVIPESWEHGSK